LIGGVNGVLHARVKHDLAGARFQRFARGEKIGERCRAVREMSAKTRERGQFADQRVEFGRPRGVARKNGFDIPGVFTRDGGAGGVQFGWA
jgi:hypothetical protein